MRSKTVRWKGDMDEVYWLPRRTRLPTKCWATRIDLVKRDYDVLRAATDAEYPLLASMSDPNNPEAQRNLAKLGQGVGLEAAAVAGEKVAFERRSQALEAAQNCWCDQAAHEHRAWVGQGEV